MGWYNTGGWQSRGWGNAAAGGGGGGAHSTAYTNFIARTTGLDTTHQNAYATLLDGLTTDGIFNSDGTSNYLDALYIFKTADSATASLNLVSSNYAITTSGSPTFTADAGWAVHAATSDYLNSNFNPSTAISPKWALNSASGGVYGISGWTSPAFAAGTVTGIRLFALVAHQDTQIIQGTVNVNTIFGSGTLAAGQPANGSFIAIDRSTSTTTTLFYNGTSVGSDSTTASSAVPSGAIAFGANPEGSNYYDQTLGAAYLGASLGGTQQSNISGRIATFMATV